MPAIIARTDCASRETLRDLLEERVDDGLRPALEAHLEHCAACATTFSELAAQWSLATLAGARAAEGPATRAIQQGERREQQLVIDRADHRRGALGGRHPQRAVLRLRVGHGELRHPIRLVVGDDDGRIVFRPEDVQAGQLGAGRRLDLEIALQPFEQRRVGRRRRAVVTSREESHALVIGIGRFAARRHPAGRVGRGHRREMAQVVAIPAKHRLLGERSATRGCSSSRDSPTCGTSTCGARGSASWPRRSRAGSSGWSSSGCPRARWGCSRGWRCRAASGSSSVTAECPGPRSPVPPEPVPCRVRTAPVTS